MRLTLSARSHRPATQPAWPSSPLPTNKTARQPTQAKMPVSLPPSTCKRTAHSTHKSAQILAARPGPLTSGLPTGTFTKRMWPWKCATGCTLSRSRPQPAEASSQVSLRIFSASSPTRPSRASFPRNFLASHYHPNARICARSRGSRRRFCLYGAAEGGRSTSARGAAERRCRAPDLPSRASKPPVARPMHVSIRSAAGGRPAPRAGLDQSLAPVLVVGRSAGLGRRLNIRPGAILEYS